MSQKQQAVVIGAGIVGACCSYALQLAGYQVALVEKDVPARAASAGNSGSIGLASVTPLGLPDTLRKAPRMFLDPMHPLSVRLAHLPHMVPWFARFVATLSDQRVRSIAAARAALLQHAAGAYDRLLDRMGKQALIYKAGLLFVYETADGAQRNSYDIALRRTNGVHAEEISGDDARRRVPALSERVRSAVLYPDVRTTVHPVQLVEEIISAAVMEGVRLLKEEARTFVTSKDRVVAVLTSMKRRDCDLLVIAAGAWSRDLAKRLGLNVLLAAERGYNVTIRNPGIELRTPVFAGDRNVVFVPMNGGIRMTTGAEFAAIDARPDHDKALRIFRAAAPTLRDLRFVVDERWIGSRPSTPDSLPIIGSVPGFRNAFCAFGHGHLGLTFGAITAEIVADLAAGRQPPVDMSAYRPDRRFDGSHLPVVHAP